MGNNASTPVTPQTIYKAASANNVSLLIVSCASVTPGTLFPWICVCNVRNGDVLQEVLGKVPREQLHTFLEPQDECGWTPLMVAAAKGNAAAAQEVNLLSSCLLPWHLS